MKRLYRYACALLGAGSLALYAGATEPPSTKTSAPELTIETARANSASADGVAFTVTFHNHSSTNLLLNGGELLGNGAQLWSSLAAELKSDTGRRIPMTLGWGVPGVAGRIYSLGLPLRAGSSFALPVNANDYFIGNGDHLPPGKYEIQFIYRGKPSPYRDATQMPACWEGEARSNPLKFEVSSGFTPFPIVPPIADADPAIRHSVAVQVPVALQVLRRGDTLTISFPDVQTTNLMVGNKMVTGITSEENIYRDEVAQPRGRSLQGGSIFQSYTNRLTLGKEGLPPMGQEFIFERRVTLFETDLPSQHMWSPQSGKHYKVLWTRTFRETVK